MIKIGCHVSNNGDAMLAGSVREAVNYNANCFMVYLGAPQSTIRKEIQFYNIDLFNELLNRNGINKEDVIIHAPYIVNLAQPDEEKRKYAIDFITSEMRRMAIVGCRYMVLHPGAHMKEGIDLGLTRIADSIKQILNNTKGDDTYIALETMAGKGSECCSKFEEIKKLMDLVDSDRVVVCFDTCHTNDSGYDLVNNYEGVLKEFDNVIGLDKIKVFHINDSKNPIESHKDRHENIGFGTIGFDTLIKFIYDERFSDIPKILETPYVTSGVDSIPPYKYEIQMIRNKVFDPELINKIILNKGV